MKSNKKTAVGYTRLSQQSDTSIPRQKEHIREYCDEHGFELFNIFDDGERASGFSDDRDEYQQLLDEIQSNNIDVLITNDKRRIARDIDEVMRLIPDLRRHNIEYHTHTDGQIGLDDPMRAAIEILQAAAAYEEKMQEIQKAIEAVEERVEDKNVYHGGPPVGMQFDDSGKNLVPRHRPGEDDKATFDEVVEAIKAKQNGASFTDIEEEFGIPRGTMHGVLERKERYFRRM